MSETTEVQAIITCPRKQRAVDLLRGRQEAAQQKIEAWRQQVASANINQCGSLSYVMEWSSGAFTLAAENDALLDLIAVFSDNHTTYELDMEMLTQRALDAAKRIATGRSTSPTANLIRQADASALADLVTFLSRRSR